MSPAGWTFDGVLWKNTGVNEDPIAIERGGSLAFNPETLGTVIIPWSDGTAAKLRFNPVLPDGVKVCVPEEIDCGWRYPCQGALSKIEIVDLKLAEKLSYLSSFGAEGLKIIWWMAATAVKDDGGGFWRPKRSTVSGPGIFSANLQINANEDGEPSGPYVDGSIAYYGSDERQNVALRPDGTIKRAYHTGKIWHSPAPLAVFWGANRKFLGVVKGKLEWDGEASQEVKAYPLEECMNFVSGGAVEVSIDATIGYTGNANGYYSQTYGLRVYPTNGFTPESDGTVESMSWYGSISDYTGNGVFAIVDHSNRNLLQYSQINTIPEGNPGQTEWRGLSYGTNKPSITTTQAINLVVATNGGSSGCVLSPMFDSVSGNYVYKYNSRFNSGGAVTDALPNPLTAGSYDGSSRRFSLYLTYTAAPSGQPAIRRFKNPIGITGIKVN
jgi:hypothetical protein